MMNPEAQSLFDNIGKLKNDIRIKRLEKASAGEVTSTWPIDNASRSAMIAFVSNAATNAGLSNAQISTIISDLNSRLGAPGSVVTVAMLEGQLIALQSQINDDLLVTILGSITSPATQLQNSSNELQIAIDKLNDLNELFSTFAVAVNLVAALIQASSGKFGPLVSTVSELI